MCVSGGRTCIQHNQRHSAATETSMPRSCNVNCVVVISGHQWSSVAIRSGKQW